MASALPISLSATKTRHQVAAIDFGTTYSGYAFSFRHEFLENPLKILTNKWETRAGTSTYVSMKTPSCILFSPDQQFNSFGYDAEDKYMWLAMEGNHENWFFFKHFKMLLYEHRNLTRATKISDDKGLQMSALKVFTESIRYLKGHLLQLFSTKGMTVNAQDIHWVLTVPAIWDDAAKQFMREAAVEAGINTENLSLALEPEAASLYCRYLPMNKVTGSDGQASINAFNPGKRYVVLDAGGGTIDITVHESMEDGTVKEVYKANGGPWGGTTVDKAFLKFMETIAGNDVMTHFQSHFKEDYLELMRDFEIKKRMMLLNGDKNNKVVFRLPLAIHDTFKTFNGTDFRLSLMQDQEINKGVSFSGDKLRFGLATVQAIFQPTIDHIVSHVSDIFLQPTVRDVDTIIMVGGFSESAVLQEAIRTAFPGKRLAVPEDAGLAVLKGAVIFGHNPRAIVARVARLTYGNKTRKRFDPAIHPMSKRSVVEGIARCRDCFDKHIEIDTIVPIGLEVQAQHYFPLTSSQTQMAIRVFTSPDCNPQFTDDDGCRFVGELTLDLPEAVRKREKEVSVKMFYGETELRVEACVVKTGQVLKASFNFLQ